jgi:hypothetical protein
VNWNAVRARAAGAMQRVAAGPGADDLVLVKRTPLDGDGITAEYVESRYPLKGFTAGLKDGDNGTDGASLRVMGEALEGVENPGQADQVEVNGIVHRVVSCNPGRFGGPALYWVIRVAA